MNITPLGWYYVNSPVLLVTKQSSINSVKVTPIEKIQKDRQKLHRNS